MSKIFDKALKEVSDDVKRFVDNSFDVVNQIHHVLTEKNLSQRDLAKMLNKKESEVSKWMSGTHNFTLRSISKIESVLNEEIVSIPIKSRKKYYTVKFVPVKTHAKPNQTYPSKEDYQEEGYVKPSKKESNLCKVA